MYESSWKSFFSALKNWSDVSVLRQNTRSLARKWSPVTKVFFSNWIRKRCKSWVYYYVCYGLWSPRVAKEVCGEHPDGHGPATLHTSPAIQGRSQVERQHEEGAILSGSCSLPLWWLCRGQIHSILDVGTKLWTFLQNVRMGGTFQATARFQDSDIFQKAIEVALRLILSVNSHLSGFKL